jgi:uncharacterized protein (DUF433 family)
MVDAPIEHISLDESGTAYIRGTTLKVADLAIDAETWGMTARQIRENHPRLSLAQIHAALAYYYDHKDAIDAQIAREVEEVERLRAKNPNPLTRQQLQDGLKQGPSSPGSA